MPQLIVTVKRLNKRRMLPVSFPDRDNIIGEVKEGFSFEGEEVALSEIPNPELGKWYKDRDGYYYWGGGVRKHFNRDIPSERPEFFNWMINLRIPDIWLHSTGKNIGVAVIDTGISSDNKDLQFDKSNFYIYNKNSSLHDSNGHGTHCAALVGSRNKGSKAVGVAFDCNLYICKISETSSLKESETIRYAEAINWCADQEDVKVISISWASFINDPQIISQIQLAITKAAKKNKVIVCATGDASQFNDPGPTYPVSLENTIGIGSIPVQDFLYPYINEGLTLILEGFNIASYGLNGEIIEMSGTSQSNAIIAGVIALIIEKKKLQYSASEIKKILLDASTIQNFNEIQIPVLNGDLLLKYFQS